MELRKTFFAFLSVATITFMWSILKFTSKTSTMMRRVHPESVLSELPELPPEPRFRYADVQVLVDKSTIVYVGYYDTREKETVVKMPAFFDTKKNIFKFTCNLHYPDQIETKVEAEIRLVKFSWMGNMTRYQYRTAMIICPVSKKSQIPSYVLLAVDGINNETTKITVKQPAKKNNNLTRCIKHFIKTYDNVTQLVWNIEFYRILGVDKQIFYLNNQTQRVLDVLKSYEKEGVVELRSFDLAKLPVKYPEKQLQAMVLQECLLSEMNTAKYVLLVDVDEIVFPRVHRNIIEMADFLFQKKKKIGSLRFRLAFYPIDINVTNVSFPNKGIAEKYNIHPLLYTKRYTTLRSAGPKSLVKPKSVDVMFVHVVESFINGDHELTVDDDIGVLNHYRKGTNRYLEPPVFTNTEVYRFSEAIIDAISARYKVLDRYGKDRPLF